ncbi:unnamed protein product [Polarella glacialis]|uniref:Rhomboid-like protease n=1 Tax=Polarella glacialis TaxID=89957 RepID=A0A813K155_POLGL|nr:unnamed protein product [Polarella glacialis]
MSQSTWAAVSIPPAQGVMHGTGNSAPPQVFGAAESARGYGAACCEGRALGREHSASCTRLQMEILDEEMALALQASELQAAQQQQNVRQQQRQQQQQDMRFQIWDPLWGDIKLTSSEAPGFCTRLLLNCCPCVFVSCRTDDGFRAWRSFLLSWACLLGFAQVIALAGVIALSGGHMPLEENPMIGPHYHALDPAGAKNAARIKVFDEWWRLLSAVMLHAGWLHLAGNLIIQLRTGAMLEVLFGHSAWLLIYIISGAYSELCSCVINPSKLGVGSSGALCGLVGAWLSFILITWNQTLPLDVKARNVQAFSVGFSIIIIVASSFLPLMDFAAHIGGLIMGISLAMVLFAGRLQHMPSRWATRIAGFCLGSAFLGFTVWWFVTQTETNAAMLSLCQPPSC